MRGLLTAALTAVRPCLSQSEPGLLPMGRQKDQQSKATMRPANGNGSISQMRCTRWCRAAAPSAVAGGPTMSCQVSSPATEQEISCVPPTFECGGCSCAGEYLFPDFVSLDEEAQLIHMLDHEEPAWRDSSFNGKYR